MLFKVVHNLDVFELNPSLRAIEAFDKLTDKQMKFVILFCDPSKDNPIRTLTGKARRERACILSGYPMEADGKRLAKNARDIVSGSVGSIEHAIAEFRKNFYDEASLNRDALRRQIGELREFLNSDKRVPLINKKGELILNADGEQLYNTDYKALKAATELAQDLPKLEKALEEMEADMAKENKAITAVPTVEDIPEEDLSEDNIPSIELYHRLNGGDQHTGQD